MWEETDEPRSQRHAPSLGVLKEVLLSQEQPTDKRHISMFWYRLTIAASSDGWGALRREAIRPARVQLRMCMLVASSRIVRLRPRVRKFAQNVLLCMLLVYEDVKVPPPTPEILLISVWAWVIEWNQLLRSLA